MTIEGFDVTDKPSAITALEAAFWLMVLAGMDDHCTVSLLSLL